MSDFETCGYFEELVDAVTAKLYGTRRVEKPDRALGAAGTIVLTIAEPFQVMSGHREVRIPASKRAPKVVKATLQRLCGRVIP